MMHYIGLCSVCEEGPLGVRICGQNHMMIMCDECQAVWLDPNLIGEPYYPQRPDFSCPYGDDTLFGEGAHWASIEEIRQRGWESFVIGESSSSLDISGGRQRRGKPPDDQNQEHPSGENGEK